MGSWLRVGVALGIASSAAGAQVRTWSVGAGGQLSWESQALIAAAVEVDSGSLRPSGFSEGDNIVATLSWVDVGGTPADLVSEGQARVWSNVASKTANQDLVMVDGLPSTSTGEAFKARGVRQVGRRFTFDLGASFPANRIVFYPTDEGRGDFLRGYKIQISDGRDFDREGRPRYKLLRLDDLSAAPRVEILFRQQLLRFIELEVLSPNPFEIAELEVYGGGFVPRARFESAYLELGSPVNFGSLRLRVERVGDSPAGGAEVALQVRSGLDRTPLIYYAVDPETQSESEITAEEYGPLEERKRTVRYDSRNWSAWSEALVLSQDGTFELDLSPLPGPRPFFQFALSFSGTSAQIMRVRQLEFTYSRPLALTGKAEVALQDEPTPAGGVAMTATGQPARFLYGVAARVSAADPGFDGIRIQTPERPQFLSLTMGDPAEAVTPDSTRLDADGLRVYFPSRRVAAGDSATLWVAFETSPLLYSTLFRGWLLDTGGQLPQPLDAGDAGARIGTNSLLVYGSLGDPLGRFELSAAMVTPNGDGRNDVVDVSFNLAFLVDEARVDLAVYDLAGRRVAHLFSGGRSAGPLTVTWDGSGPARETLQPGHYICRLEVETQSQSFERSLILALAY